MYQSFFRGSAKFGGQTVNEIHVNKQKRDDRFVPPLPLRTPEFPEFHMCES